MAGCSASLSLEEAPELPSSSCWFCLVFFRNTPLLAQARKIKRLAAQHSSQRSRGISWTVLDTSSSVGTAVLCSSCVSCFQWSSECPNCCSTISFNCLTVELTASCSLSHDKQAGSRRLVYPLEEQGPRYAFFVMSGRYALPLAHATGRLMSRSTGLVTSCSFTSGWTAGAPITEFSFSLTSSSIVFISKTSNSIRASRSEWSWWLHLCSSIFWLRRSIAARMGEVLWLSLFWRGILQAQKKRDIRGEGRHLRAMLIDLNVARRASNSGVQDISAKRSS